MSFHKMHIIPEGRDVISILAPVIELIYKVAVKFGE